MSVALLDYGAGNVPSVARALDKLGAERFIATTPADLQRATAIILPGVGHYASLVRALDQRGLRSPLLDAISRELPFLGICLGLQALYSGSDEAPSLPGLGLLPGVVQSLPPTEKLPHMGWNRLRILRSSPLLQGLAESDYFYFAHSFAAPDSSSTTVAISEHGGPFVAVLQSSRIFATQFHPEKSGAAGARLLQNFLSLAT